MPTTEHSMAALLAAAAAGSPTTLGMLAAAGRLEPLAPRSLHHHAGSPSPAPWFTDPSHLISSLHDVKRAYDGRTKPGLLSNGSSPSSSIVEYATSSTVMPHNIRKLNLFNLWCPNVRNIGKFLNFGRWYLMCQAWKVGRFRDFIFVYDTAPGFVFSL